ncbi:hypothetical protein LguiA_004465 [Lonicera macranthoides]
MVEEICRDSFIPSIVEDYSSLLKKPLRDVLPRSYSIMLAPDRSNELLRLIHLSITKREKTKRRQQLLSGNSKKDIEEKGNDILHVLAENLKRLFCMQFTREASYGRMRRFEYEAKRVSIDFERRNMWSNISLQIVDNFPSSSLKGVLIKFGVTEGGQTGGRVIFLASPVLHGHILIISKHMDYRLTSVTTNGDFCKIDDKIVVHGISVTKVSIESIQDPLKEDLKQCFGHRWTAGRGHRSRKAEEEIGGSMQWRRGVKRKRWLIEKQSPLAMIWLIWLQRNADGLQLQRNFIEPKPEVWSIVKIFF